MAQPSSTHRERSSSNHHRTISSTTLLLVLSLILAVLSVLLSIPRSGAITGSSADATTPGGILGLFSPKRNAEVISREAAVAEREAVIAKREADFLNGLPAGVTIGTCVPHVVTATIWAQPTEPVTIIKEIVKEVETLPPPWLKDPNLRVEDVLERETRVSDREKEVGRREEVVGKRESDASRRENWIMENLMVEPQVAQTGEYVTYDEAPRRPVKELPLRSPPASPSVLIETQTETKTVTVPAPANTRLAAYPSPESMTTTAHTGLPTTPIEVIVETVEAPASTVTVVERKPTRAPIRPLGWRS
ncbi:hypothetical protein BKA62DRAFT_684466 [Auriculariales sp. MPI-PUGE-AT-0066]|nr:hypothetical protein BKA62DRAFT_684466 [Auriculariales sp. MPI-PUGE-AT-0066]